MFKAAAVNYSKTLEIQSTLVLKRIGNGRFLAERFGVQRVNALFSDNTIKQSSVSFQNERFSFAHRVVIPKKKMPTRNENGKKRLSAQSQGGGLLPWWGGLVVACWFLALGVLTPPLLHMFVADSAASRRQLVLQQESVVADDDAGGGAETNVSRKQQQQQPDHSCTEERLNEFWHDAPVRGLHILCFSQQQANGSSPQQQQQQVLTTYANALKRNEKTTTILLSSTWSALKETLRSHLDLTPWTGKKQPWAVFSPEGERLVSENEYDESAEIILASSLLQDHGLVLLLEGGQFVWPGVRIGFERLVQLYSIMPEGSPHYDSDKNKNVTLETLSITPLVLSVSGFLSESECAHVQQVAAPTMEYSGVVLMDKDAGRPASDFRTSQTTFVAADHDDILTDIDYRTASLVRVPRNHQEYTQVLRYGVTEKYSAHHDYFDPRSYQNDKSTLRLIRNGDRNRMSTVFWYLTTVEVGGETVFPRFNGGVERSTSDCETGLKVKPEAGKVIIFYSMHPDGSPDPASLHGACPVKEGVKWAANKVRSSFAVF